MEEHRSQVWSIQWKMKDFALHLLIMMTVIFQGHCWRHSKQISAFHWTIGPWSMCVGEASCGEGWREREVWCVDSSGFQTNHLNCVSSEKPSSLEPCFRVCDDHQHLLRWHADEWSACEHFNSHPHLHTYGDCREEETGISRRNISCIYQPHHGPPRVVDSAACTEIEPQPESERECMLSCPQDCVVTDFSEWPECNGCESKNISRHRTVIVAPENGGLSCPSLHETRLCHPPFACLRQVVETKSYHLKVGPWGPCTPFGPNSVSEVEQLIGVKERIIECLNDEGNKVNISECLADDAKVLPESVEACVVRKDCQVSPWSKWYVEKDGCIKEDGQILPKVKYRFRHIIQLPLGSGEPCPPLQEKRVQVEDVPLCSEYTWIFSDWSECDVVSDTVPTNDSPYMLPAKCGGGIRTRNLTCVRASDQVPVSSIMCRGPRPSTFVECSVPCPIDCEVSEWSEWSRCLPLVKSSDSSHKHHLKFGPGRGYSTRGRTIKVEPQFDGNECPHLREIEPCEIAVMFSWKTHPWGECRLYKPNEKCGKGNQTREADCYFLDKKEKNHGPCLLHEYIDRDRPCHIPCPNECVLSEWSSWSPCSLQCFDMVHGEKKRTRTILAYPEDGTPCAPELESLKEEDFCNTDSCVGFHWKTEPWSQCIPDKNASCGEGTQKRQVNCFSRELVKDKKCSGVQKPGKVQKCVLPCPVDCVVSNFTEWKLCWECENGPVLQRERFILKHPAHGGQSCPTNLKEVFPCEKIQNKGCKSRAKYTYFWNVTEWSDCILPDALECGRGFQVRNVTCLRSDGREADISSCFTTIENRISMTEIFDSPKPYRSCFVGCNVPCVVSEWYPWSTCDTGCQSSSYRTRILIGDSAKIKACSKAYPLREERACPGTLLMNETERHWTKCITEKANESDDCGIGRKYKFESNISVDTCVETGIRSYICSIPCPVDCLMGSWSQWSPCNVTCGTGIQQRSRRVLRYPKDGGRPCPANIKNEEEIQVDVCHVECPKTVWLAEGWTPCKVAKTKREGTRPVCGFGKHTRPVRCMAMVNNLSKYKVDQTLCEPEKKPTEEENCRIYCPGECVVSDWSPWTPCDNCSFQNCTRSRKVLRPPDDKHECPSLSESDLCASVCGCSEYEWKTGRESSCVLPLDASCGKGYVKKPLYCLRKSDGMPGNDNFCNKETKPKISELEKPCHVPCPIDCKVSSWTDWDTSECSSCEKFSFMTRTRQVMQNATSSGRPCPNLNKQRKPCPYKECYHWVIGNWTECFLSGAKCGYGIRHREVKCVRSDKAVVDERYCHLVNFTSSVTGLLGFDWIKLGSDVQKEESCYVPCSSDCQLTPWSAWSHCDRDCGVGQIVGKQTRSRSIQGDSSKKDCVKEMWETKPCWNGQCLTFNWQVKEGVIKCLRSDGLIVEGGCRGRPRPCWPSCPENARCKPETGQCSCLPGTVPVFEAVPGNGDSVDNVPGKLDALNRPVRCQKLRKMGTGQSVNHTGSVGEMFKYAPDDSEAGFWMYAMISVGSAFVIFVAVTVYLMCHSSLRQRLTSSYTFLKRRRDPSSSNSSEHRSNSYTYEGPVSHVSTRTAPNIY